MCRSVAGREVMLQGVQNLVLQDVREVARLQDVFAGFKRRHGTEAGFGFGFLKSCFLGFVILKIAGFNFGFITFLRLRTRP